MKVVSIAFQGDVQLLDKVRGYSFMSVSVTLSFSGIAGIAF